MNRCIGGRSPRFSIPTRRQSDRINRKSLHINASYDAIVVGLGAMGKFRPNPEHLYRIKACEQVLGLEQFEVGHAFGSSHGYTRIYREAHETDGDYIPLAQKAGKLWEELEEDSKLKLLHRCGTLYLGQSLCEPIKEFAKEYQFDTVEMTAEEAMQNYAGLHCHDPSAPAVLEPQGGYLESNSIVHAHVDLAKKMQANVRMGERVVQWMPDGSGVRVDTQRQTYYAQTLLLTSGPWITALVPQLQETCMVERQVVGWYNSKPRELFIPESLPTLIWNTFNAESYAYSIPANGNQGLKVAKYNHLEEIVDPDTVDRNVRQEDVDVLQKTLNSLFRPEQHQLGESSVCLFTNAPDENFIIDQHPLYPQVFVCSPCSGFGFKYSSAIGKILSNMIIEDIDEDTRQLLQRFSLKRPSLGVISSFD